MGDNPSEYRLQAVYVNKETGQYTVLLNNGAGDSTEGHGHNVEDAVEDALSVLVRH